MIRPPRALLRDLGGGKAKCENRPGPVAGIGAPSAAAFDLGALSGVPIRTLREENAAASHEARRKSLSAS
jgi:hypothetical protein